MNAQNILHLAVEKMLSEMGLSSDEIKEQTYFSYEEASYWLMDIANGSELRVYFDGHNIKVGLYE